ncbi:RASGRP2 isoform 17 [Pan troglodytes]|uniref:RAS guanyl releasing protein 2 n=3 Tax=Hominidae TaxID=9604 RepID=A8MVK8_HUMAN|nr:RAS guanyl releasing protein 2 [Homo sapiens]PNI94031.1 RASGRP2 isoform 12 [Pan troglodytes]PNJ38159.1 RASGRP2 isoform 5 [Pongo abelii]KAI2560760.1 RAS guanyl releasing protein 2 [Homo sapiens]KAI4072071.1 RAS guanyl releasing protein 2 [Homo sapiens]
MAGTLDLDKGCTVEELLRGCIEAFAGGQAAPHLPTIPEGQLQFPAGENVPPGQVLDLRLPSGV